MRDQTWAELTFRVMGDQATASSREVAFKGVYTAFFGVEPGGNNVTRKPAFRVVINFPDSDSSEEGEGGKRRSAHSQARRIRGQEVQERCGEVSTWLAETSSQIWVTTSTPGRIEIMVWYCARARAQVKCTLWVVLVVVALVGRRWRVRELASAAAEHISEDVCLWSPVPELEDTVLERRVEMRTIESLTAAEQRVRVGESEVLDIRLVVRLYGDVL